MVNFGNLTDVKKAIKNGLDVNSFIEGRTPLQRATSYRNESVIKFLLDKGANQNPTILDGLTPLQNATFIPNNEKVVKLLLDKGANPSAPILQGMTPLQNASLNEDNNVMKMLLDRGVNPNETMHQGRTSLQISSETGSKKSVKLLLEYGADPNATGTWGMTPLQEASGLQYGNLTVLKLLLEKGANPNGPILEGIMPLLQAARYGGQREDFGDRTLKLLLYAAADPNVRNPEGNILYPLPIMPFPVDPGVNAIIQEKNTPLEATAENTNRGKSTFLLIAFGARTQGLENNAQIANVLNEYGSSEGVMREQVRRMTGIRNDAKLNLKLESLDREDLLSLVKYIGASKLTPGFVVNFKQITEDGIQRMINEYSGNRLKFPITPNDRDPMESNDNSGNRVPERIITKKAKEALLLIEKIKPQPTIEVGFKKEAKKRFNMFTSESITRQ